MQTSVWCATMSPKGWRRREWAWVVPGSWASLHHLPGWAAAVGREGRRRIEIVTQGPGTCSEGCPGVFGRGVGDIYLRYEVLAMLVVSSVVFSKLTLPVSFPCHPPLSPASSLLSGRWDAFSGHSEQISKAGLHTRAYHGCGQGAVNQHICHDVPLEAGCLPGGKGGVVAHARPARSAVSHELGSARGRVAFLG